MAEKWALAMRNLEQMAIFQLEIFRPGQKEASAYYAELRTANEIPATSRKLLEQIKSMTEAGAVARFRTATVFLAGPRSLESEYFKEKIGRNFCLEQVKNFQVGKFPVFLRTGHHIPAGTCL